MKETIFYIVDKKINSLIAWTNKPKLLSNYIKITSNNDYEIKKESIKFISRKYPYYEDKKLIKFKNNILIKEHQEFLEEQIDGEYFKLADTIEFLKSINSKYKLSEKENKRINKSIEILKDLFIDFDEYYTLDVVGITHQTLIEIQQQNDHIKQIIREE